MKSLHFRSFILLIKFSFYSLFPQISNAMILKTSEHENASRTLGSMHGEAICSVQVFYFDQNQLIRQSINTGTLINIDRSLRIGTVLTAAHAFMNRSTPLAITISFDPFLSPETTWILADHYQIHPRFSFETEKGEDLALIQFRLPPKFRIKPMHPTSTRKLFQLAQNKRVLVDGVSHLHFKTFYMVGSYGLSATSGQADWDFSPEKKFARRIGYTQAHYHSINWEFLSYPHHFVKESNVTSQNEIQVNFPSKPVQFSFDHDSAFLKHQIFESMLNVGDSGGPLFFFDNEKDCYRIAGVFSFQQGSPHASIYHHWQAFTEETLDWFHLSFHEFIEIPPLAVEFEFRIKSLLKKLNSSSES